jgi:GTP:adenosylcobinamide-phosphate guanylyltransferase
MDAVVLAGGRLTPEFGPAAEAGLKALLRFQEETLLARVVRAIRGCEGIGRVAVVGPPELEGEARAARADVFVPEGETGPDNLLRGVRALAASGRILVSASDLPFLLPEDVGDVIARVPAGVQLTYSLVESEAFQRAFPGAKHLTVPLADGHFIGGCVFVLDAPTLLRLEPELQRAFAARRSQLAMARVVGVRLLPKVVLGHLSGGRWGPSTEELRGRIEKIVACRGAVIKGCSPRIAFDIDYPRDWEYVCHPPAARQRRA